MIPDAGEVTRRKRVLVKMSRRRLGRVSTKRIIFLLLGILLLAGTSHDTHAVAYQFLL